MIMHKRFKPKELALLISLGCVMAAPAVLAQEAKRTSKAIPNHLIFGIDIRF